MAAGFAEAAIIPVAAGLAATGALFVVAVASAAVFLVGIVAFRSVVAAAFGATVLLEVLAAFDDVGAALLGDALLSIAAFAATLLRAALVAALDALAFSALAFSILGVVAARGLAAVRALVVAELFAAGRPVVPFLVPFTLVSVVALDRTAAAERVALARLTEAPGGVAVRAAALDAAAGLAVRPGDAVDDLADLKTLSTGVFVARALAVEIFAVGAFVLAEVGLVARDLVEADLVEADLVEADLVEADLVEADLVEADLVEADLIIADLVAAGLAATAPAALRTRAAGLVLGDISATPEIGRPSSYVIDDDVPKGRQGT